MEKYESHLPKTNERQVKFGRLLGLDFTGLTVRVAKAIIKDYIEKNYDGLELRSASKKQIELGKKFDLDFSELTVGVASAYIKDILVKLNFKSIEEQNIKPGDYVINKYSEQKDEHIVSSINKEGYIYFKKGSGGAARYLIKTNKEIVKELINNILKKYNIVVESNT
jgi:hypothetical protein